MAKRLQKKSYAPLAGMIVLVSALIALLIFWTPEASAQTAQPSVESTTIVKEGAQAPDFTVEMFDGTKVTLSELKGKVVLVNFWATWCPPCRNELARVEKEIIERFKGQEFVFLPISRGESKEKIAEFRNKMGYTFPMGLDTTQAIFKKYATNYIPRNFLVDREGKVVKASVGYDDAEFAALVKLIEKEIKK
ncbi:MAG: redoxin domain-containing protein [Alistipes sp.]|nr:redoxin domain-containing protein [Alistipes sp.]